MHKIALLALVLLSPTWATNDAQQTGERNCAAEISGGSKVDHEQFAQLITERIKSSGKSGNEVARLCNISQGSLSNIKNGKRRVSFDLALKLAEVLEISDEELSQHGYLRRPPRDPDAFSTLLATHAEASGDTLTQIAADLGISQGYLSHLVQGTRTRPQKVLVWALASRLAIPVNQALKAAGFTDPSENQGSP